MGVYTEIKEILSGYPSFYALVYACCIDQWEEHGERLTRILEEDDFSFDDFCDLVYYLWNSQNGDGYSLDEIATMVCDYVIEHHKQPNKLSELIK